MIHTITRWLLSYCDMKQDRVWGSGGCLIRLGPLVPQYPRMRRLMYRTRIGKRLRDRYMKKLYDRCRVDMQCDEQVYRKAMAKVRRDIERYSRSNWVSRA